MGMQNDYDGGLPAVSVAGMRSTYRTRAAALTPAANATDVFTLVGSATKIVRVSRLTISGVATSSGVYAVNIMRRSAANTGGTPTNPTPDKTDITDVAATATVNIYTANPTLVDGTGVNIGADRVILANATAPVTEHILTFEYGWHGEKQPILRGIADLFCVNFGGAAVPTGASLYINIEWTEASA